MFVEKCFEVFLELFGVSLLFQGDQSSQSRWHMRDVRCDSQVLWQSFTDRHSQPAEHDCEKTIILLVIVLLVDKHVKRVYAD